METVLAFENVYAGYGRTNVLDGLSFTMEKGRVFGVIGPNGSGKTTMLNALAGLIRPTKGRILFSGKDITRLAPDARCRMGIGRTFQIPRPFGRMTVFENVLTAAVFGAGLPESEGGRAAMRALRITDLMDKAEALSDSLTLLDRKRLEIARALGMSPALLLLDEVAAGLTSLEVQAVMALVKRLKEEGSSIIWIEHVMEAMMGAADQLMCVAEGRCLALGDPEAVLSSRAVKQIYLGVERHA
ncbi:MAG: ABC transporter ATP-binding protein [Clostridia bacterium]|nr:ABC transporter ATP-binding protein [Clostridia bacterium]